MDVTKAYQATQLARVRTEQTRPQPKAGSKSAGVSVSVAISRPAGLLNKLASLQEEDETRFKHLMGAVGSNLKAAANAPSGSVGTELGALADQLLQVAKTGDLAALSPTVSSMASVGAASRAVEAYRRNTPSVSEPSGNVQQALDYLLTAAEESRIAP